MLPDLNRLKVFYHIYNEESSTAAARVLHITQSGVSQHLKKLEEELQTALFTRVNRRLVPTAAGHELHGIVKNFITALEEGVRRFDESRDVPAGLLRIGAPAEFGKTYLPNIVSTFHKAYPKVQFQLELHDPPTLFAMVSAGELDFAYIDILPIYLQTADAISAYRIEPVIDEEFILACSRQYYLEQITKGTYEELTGLNYISYKQDIALFRSWFNLHYGNEPAALKLVLVVDCARTIISAIEEGMGAGIIVSHFVSRQLQEGSLVQLGPARKKLKNSIACVMLKNTQPTFTESSFQGYFRQRLRTLSNPAGVTL